MGKKSLPRLPQPRRRPPDASIMDINGEPRVWKHVPTRTQARKARLERGWKKQLDHCKDQMKPESHRRG